MKALKSLLNIGNSIEDITDHVQLVGAHVDGELKYRGCGLEIFRSNHINGNAVIFINYVGQELIFGEWVNVYALSPKWKHWDYAKYEMKPLEGKLPLISGNNKTLRDEFII